MSRTDPAEELWKAAAMTEGGLSRGEILSLIKGAFEAAFLPLPEREKRLLEVDEEVFDLLVGESEHRENVPPA